MTDSIDSGFFRKAQQSQASSGRDLDKKIKELESTLASVNKTLAKTVGASNKVTNEAIKTQVLKDLNELKSLKISRSKTALKKASKKEERTKASERLEKAAETDPGRDTEKAAIRAVSEEFAFFSEQLGISFTGLASKLFGKKEDKDENVVQAIEESKEEAEANTEKVVEAIQTLPALVPSQGLGDEVTSETTSRRRSSSSEEDSSVLAEIIFTNELLQEVISVQKMFGEEHVGIWQDHHKELVDILRTISEKLGGASSERAGNVQSTGMMTVQSSPGGTGLSTEVLRDAPFLRALPGPTETPRLESSNIIDGEVISSREDIQQETLEARADQHSETLEALDNIEDANDRSRGLFGSLLAASGPLGLMLSSSFAKIATGFTALKGLLPSRRRAGIPAVVPSRAANIAPGTPPPVIAGPPRPQSRADKVKNVAKAGVKGAGKGLGTLLRFLGPIGAVVSGFALLGTVASKLLSEEQLNSISEGVNKVGEFFGDLIKDVPGLSETVSSVGSFLKDAFGPAFKTFTDLGESVFGALSTAFSGLGMIVDLVKTDLASTDSSIQPVLTFLKEFFGGTILLFGSALETGISAIKTVFDTAVAVVETVGKGIGTAAGFVVVTTGKAIKLYEDTVQSVSDGFTGLGNFFTTTFEKFKDINLLKTILDVVLAPFRDIKDFLENPVEKIKKELAQGRENLSKGKEIGGKVLESVSNTAAGVRDSFFGLIKDTFGSDDEVIAKSQNVVPITKKITKSEPVQNIPDFNVGNLASANELENNIAQAEVASAIKSSTDQQSQAQKEIKVELTNLNKATEKGNNMNKSSFSGKRSVDNTSVITTDIGLVQVLGGGLG